MPDLNTNSIDSFHYGINVLPLLKFWYHLLIFCFKPEGLYLLWNTKEDILKKKNNKKNYVHAMTFNGVQNNILTFEFVIMVHFSLNSHSHY